MPDASEPTAEMREAAVTRLSTSLVLRLAAVDSSDPDATLMSLIAALYDAYDAGKAAARADERERAAKIVAQWLRASHIQLHAGEMTEQELRSVKAVVKAIARAIRRQGNEKYFMTTRELQQSKLQKSKARRAFMVQARRGSATAPWRGAVDPGEDE